MDLPLAIGFNSGLVGVIGFTILRTDNAVHTTRTTAGVTESNGAYYASAELADADLPLIVKWDDGTGGEAFAPVAALTADAIALATEQRIANAGDGIDIAQAISAKVEAAINDEADGTLTIAALASAVETKLTATGGPFEAIDTKVTANGMQALRPDEPYEMRVGAVTDTNGTNVAEVTFATPTE